MSNGMIPTIIVVLVLYFAAMVVIGCFFYAREKQRGHVSNLHGRKEYFMSNGMIPTIIVVLVLYFAAMVVIGWLGRSKASNFEGYLSMGRSAGVLLLMGGAIGGQIGNGFVVGGAAEGSISGLAGSAYGIACALSTVMVALFLNNGGAIGGQIGNGFVVGGAAEGSISGLAGSAYGIACALSTVMVALFLNNFIYNHGYMSMADYTRERYHNEIPGTIYDLSTAISSIGLIAGQIMAGKALFEALGLPGNVGAIAIAVVVLL